MVRNKVPRGSLRVIWVSRLIHNDPIVVRKDLPASLRQAVQSSLLTMRARHPEVFKELGASVGFRLKGPDAAFTLGANGAVSDGVAPDAAAILTLKDADVPALADLRDAYQRGTVRIDGDTRVAARLGFLKSLV